MRRSVSQAFNIKGDELREQSLILTFVLDRIDRELHSFERLELKFGSSSEIFGKIPVRILLDVFFRVFRFSKASFYALASSFITF